VGRPCQYTPGSVKGSRNGQEDTRSMVHPTSVELDERKGRLDDAGRCAQALLDMLSSVIPSAGPYWALASRPTRGYPWIICRSLMRGDSIQMSHIDPCCRQSLLRRQRGASSTCIGMEPAGVYATSNYWGTDTREPAQERYT